ncbi:S-layer homology domain-containing protein [Peptoniphilus sp. BV3AC2]|uniref:S-layer homology domain-containing protein n=1 Tax=Peptoniphilus sp. BV3AC2 TaxID=1111133 RepID=UPI0003B877B7|nr:S-layer homology domain-containing protein [Peptoniphilus sp. BV3AC2]ERT64471.1 SLH domain protein [Peptoniphilus sp. BV3AC2]
MRKKLITIVTLTAILLSPTNIFAKDFTDVKKGDWFYEAVTELTDAGIINGYQDNTFKPSRKVSYAEFLTLLNNTLGVKQGPDNKNPREWYNPTLNELKSKGVITEKIANPNAEISRNEMAKYLSLGLEKLKNQKLNKAEPTTIKDFNNIPNEYKDFVANVVNAGLIKGDEKQNFNGAKSLTRAETAIIIKGLGGTTQEAKKPTVDEQGLQLTDPSKPMIWKEKMKRKYVRQPQEGDIVIKADGTRVTLESGAAGILGARQGVDPYTGLIMKDGSIFKEGDIALDGWYSLYGYDGFADGKEKMSMGGQPYKIDPKTGEGHFQYEWVILRTAGAIQPPLWNENKQAIPWEKVVKPGDRPIYATDPLTGNSYTSNGQYEWTGDHWEPIM